MKLPALDLSKPPHQRSIDLVAPVLPGLFFAGSLLLGRPDLLEYLLQRASHFGYYVNLAAFLVGAYFVGLVFTIATTVLQDQTKSILWRIFHYKFDAPRRIAMRLNRRPRKNNWLTTHVTNRVAMRYSRIGMARQQQNVLTYNIWVAATRQLLKKKYMISPPEGVEANDRWSAWFRVVGKAKPSELRGSTLVRVIYAAGWLGLVSIYYAPFLRKSYYIGLTALLLLLGLIHDFYLAAFWGNPVNENLNRTINVLRELGTDNDLSADGGDSTNDPDSV